MRVRITSSTLALIVLPLGALVAGCDTQTQSEGTHVHGTARLTIAIDNSMSAGVEFTAPAESIYGFEHEASTVEEIAARDSAISVLQTHFGELLVLPEALGCRIEDAIVDIELDDADYDDDVDSDDADREGDGEPDVDSDDEHADDDVDSDDEDADDQDNDTLSGEHAEVHATYLLICSGELAGARASVTIGEVFPGIEMLSVTVLSASGQQSATLEGGTGSVDL